MLKFQSKVIKDMEAKGYTVINIIKLSANGFPDLQCLKKDSIDVWIECKEGNDTLKELQKFRINQLIKLGKIAYCLHKEKGVIYGIKET
jgi:hypothetical protein